MHYSPDCFSHFHASKSQREALSEEVTAIHRFIIVNNSVTSSNQLMPHSLSSPQPWFPHLRREREKKNESFDTLYRKSRAGLQKSSSFFKHILFGWGGSRTLWPLWSPRVPVEPSVRNWMAVVDIPVLGSFVTRPCLDYRSIYHFFSQCNMLEEILYCSSGFFNLALLQRIYYRFQLDS